jgi:hypothetical protein
MRVKLNTKAFEFAKKMIHEGKIDDRHGTAELKHHTPGLSQEEAYLKSHSWEEFGHWYLGVHFDRPENKKERYELPIGDFETIVRADVIAVQKKAHEYKYFDIDDAAKKLLELIDKKVNKK